MAPPRLTVCALVGPAAVDVERWMRRLPQAGDEVVLGVDATCPPTTVALARRVADVVVLLPAGSSGGRAADFIARRASGTWLLWLEVGEALHPDFRAHLEPWLAERTVTHYRLSYRSGNQEAEGSRPNGDTVSALAAGGGPDSATIGLTSRRYTTSSQPNRESSPCASSGPRVIRNVRSIFWADGSTDARFEVLGEGRLLEATEVGILRAVASDAVAGNPVETTGAGRAVVEPVTDTALDAQWRAHQPAADVFHARYEGDTTPTSLPANQGANATVTVRNLSTDRWRVTGSSPGRVTLSYHWEHAVYGILLWGGDVSFLPRAVAPGEAVAVDAAMWAPYEAGEYTLAWDLRADGVAWFSERGVPSRRVPVEVVDAGGRRAQPRETAFLPPRARTPGERTPGAGTPGERTPGERTPGERAPGAGTPAAGPPGAALWRRWRPRLSLLDRRRRTAAPTAIPRRVPDLASSATNVDAVAPRRVLDTRTGAGAPGARLGPVHAGDSLVLDLGGFAGLPDDLTGVVATMSILDADYDGYVSLTPGGGAGRPVTAFFATSTTADRKAAPTTVVVVVGASPESASVSIWLSDNWPGTAHLVVDVDAVVKAVRR